MALGRNHKIFNIGNASGTIQGLTRVYHDLTLSGDGTLSSLLGVVGSQDDEEVNQFVYDNSAKINDVNSSYQTNSANFLTAIPDYYATTGDINDLAQSISENYQVKGDYVERNSMASAIESATSGKLDASSFASVSGDFLVTSSLNGYATESFVEETSGAITSLIPTNYYPDTNPSAFVNEDWVTAQGYITGVDLTPYQTKSGMIDYQPKSGMVDYQTTAGMTDYATTGDVANKLDTTSFSNVSSTFLTAHQIIPSAKWENASDVVESNSAQWSENTGDEEVNNAVYNNSAKWNDISAYQENSGSYQPSGNYIPYTAAAFDGTFKTNSALWFQRPNGDTQSNYINYNTIQLRNVINVSAQTGAILTYNFLRFETYSDSAFVDKDKIHKWDNVSDYTQNNSANWNEVSSKLDSSAFSNVSGTFLTAHQDLSDYYTKSETSGADELANAFANIPAGDSEVNSYVHDTSATIDEVNSTVQSNSASWGQGGGSTSGLVSGDNVLFVPYGGFLTAAGNVYSATISGDISVSTGIYANGGESISLTTTYSLSAIGRSVKTIKSSSASWNESTYITQTNSSNWDNVTNKLDTTAFDSISGDWNEAITAYQTNSSTYLTAVDLSNYVPVSAYNELKTSYATLSSLFATYSGQWLLPNEGV